MKQGTPVRLENNGVSIGCCCCRLVHQLVLCEEDDDGTPRVTLFPDDYETEKARANMSKAERRKIVELFGGTLEGKLG